MTAVVTRFYQVRFRQWGWARLWITDDWCLTIMSDWGSYSYWWSPEKSDFRRFLCGRDDDYLMNKFAGGRSEIDSDATERWVKERICSQRRSAHLSRDEARREWDLVDGVNFDDEGERQHWYNETRLDDAWDSLIYRHPMRVQQFMKRCWPLLVVEMQRDIGQPLRDRASEWFRRAA